ncbi:MAG: TolC family protein [Planctomycetes bacterium]|nr:TolC family protein [Planctomycetota bacterium]
MPALSFSPFVSGSRIRVLDASLPLAFLLFPWLGAALWGEPASPSHTEEAAEESVEAGVTAVSEVRATLRQVILLAARKNLNLQAARLNPDILWDEVLQAESLYDSVLTTEVNGNKSRSQTISQLAGADLNRTQRADVNVALRRKFLTGTQLTGGWENLRERNNSLFVTVDPYYTSRLGVNVTQPLLKGRGFAVSEGPIRMAENSRLIGALEARRTAIDIVGRAEKAYWDLLFTKENLKVQELALQQAQVLVEDTRQKSSAGILTENDLLLAQAEAADREELIILAEQEVHGAEDQLKTITNLIENPLLWDARIIPLTAPPDPGPVPESEGLADQAFQNRPDYLSSKKDLENRDIAVVMAKNARYPQLDLNASFTLNGITDGLGDSFAAVGTMDFYDWGVGVSLDLPIGLRSGRSLFKRRQAEKAQALLQFRELGNQIVAEVRDAHRSTGAAQKRIRTTEAARKLREAKLASEEELYKAGRSTTSDLLEFQLDLAQARTHHLRAQLALLKSLVDLETAKGTLLQSRGLSFLDKLADAGEAATPPKETRDANGTGEP